MRDMSKNSSKNAEDSDKDDVKNTEELRKFPLSTEEKNLKTVQNYESVDSNVSKTDMIN